MARDYAQIVTAIWRDRDFRALCAGDQRMYLLVTTQPDITAAGTLPLTMGRWSSLASDTTPDDVRASLERLAAARFVGMDTTTEELLVRSFVRWDKGYGNPKRRPVILRAASEIVSPTLARMLAGEFVALGLPPDALSDALSEAPSEGVAERLPEGGFQEGLERSVLRDASSTIDSAFSQVDSLSDGLSDNRSDSASSSDGVVVSNVSSSFPHPSTPVPAASGRDAAERGSNPKRKAKRATALPTSWCPTEEHRKRAAASGLDLDRQVELFRLHAETNGRTAKQWNAAFSMWLTKAPTFDRGSAGPASPVPLKPIADREAAREWLLGEHREGRVSEIERRTGLRYQRPDLPDDVSGRDQIDRWFLNHRQQWITTHNATIIDRLITRNAS